MSLLNTSDLHRIFDYLDGNKDGLLSVEELKSALDTMNGHVTLDELVELFGDETSSSTPDFEMTRLDFQEFTRFYDSMFVETATTTRKRRSSHKGNIETTVVSNRFGEEQEAGEEEEGDESDLYKAFMVFDLNGDGLISAQELQSVLCKLGRCGKNKNYEYTLDCVRIIHEYDVNSDGFVDYDEFKQMMFAH